MSIFDFNCSIRVYTICHFVSCLLDALLNGKATFGYSNLGFYWTRYSKIKPHCSNFMILAFKFH